MKIYSALAFGTLIFASVSAQADYMPLPPPAQACYGPAQPSNPHCSVPAPPALPAPPVATTSPSASVSEPGSLALLSIGLACAALARRRRG